MGDSLKKVQSGDKLRIPAAAYNAFIDSAHDLHDRQRNQGRTPQAAYRTSGIVLVKNASGADQDRFAVLGVDAPIYTPDDNLDSFKNKVALVGVVPTVQDHYGRFVVLLEPLKAGAIGMAYGAGVCPVKVTIPDTEQKYQFADVNDGSTGTLLAAPLGAAFILWKEDDEATGQMWAVVRIGLPPIRPFALDPCDSEDGETRYVTNDLSKKLDKVLLVDDICYRPRVPEASEIRCIEPRCVEIQAEYDDCERCKACWLLTPCTEGSGSEIKTNTDLASHEGGVVKLGDGKCYTVAMADNCLDAVPVNVAESFDDCTRCGYCYHLQNCFDESDTLVIDNDLESELEQTPEQIVTDARVVEIAGQCYTVLAYDTDCQYAQTVAISRFFASCGECGCFKLTGCEGEEPTVIHTRRATGPGGGVIHLRDYVGQILRLDDGNCYSVEESEDCETLTDVSVQEAYDDCESCTCWLLTDCEDEESTLLTFSDLSAYGVGAIVRQAGSDPIKCCTITDTAPWSGSAVAFETDESFPDCDTCLKKRKYRLTQDCSLEDCEGEGGGGSEIITTEDLHAAVGMWVKVGGMCYSVATTESGDVTDESLSYQGPFSTCDACLESPVETKKRFITDLVLDGTNLVAKTEEMVIKGGMIVGFCSSDDITIEGTECPEESEV